MSAELDRGGGKGSIGQCRIAEPGRIVEGQFGYGYTVTNKGRNGQSQAGPGKRGHLVSKISHNYVHIPVALLSLALVCASPDSLGSISKPI